MKDLPEYEKQIVDHVWCLLDDIGLTIDELEAEVDHVQLLTTTKAASNRKDQTDRNAIEIARLTAMKASAEEKEIANKVAAVLRIINQNSSFDAYKPTRAADRLPFLERLTRFFGDDVFLELSDLHTAAVTHIAAIRSYQCQLTTAIKWFPYRNGPFNAATGRYRNTEADIQSAKDARRTLGHPNDGPQRRP